MTHDQLTYRIAFAAVRGMSPVFASELLKRIGSEDAFFNASPAKLHSIINTTAKIFEREYRDNLLRKAEAERSFIKAHNVNTLYFTESEYPKRLLECDDAPLMLYSLGDCDLNNSRMVGIVGTRHATCYGTDFTNRFVNDIAAGITNPVIVSGLAYGIDIAAHRAAMKAGIPTIAVLAHGLNTIYPADHRSDAAEILRNGGMLITDYLSSDAIHKGNFVARNRIVAGLCDCIVVAESASKGGAMITASIAADYNRDVFALPGRTSDRYSAGCNKLIATNVAALVESADDVIAAMRWPKREQADIAPQLPIPLTEDEQKIVDFLSGHEDATLNRMTVELNRPVAQLMSLLIDMEFRELIYALPGGRYRLK